MKNNLFSATQYDALSSCRIKYYYDKNGNPYPVQKMTCSEKVFRSPAFELDNDKSFALHKAEPLSDKADSETTTPSDSSIARARRMVYDLIRCNHFSHFCTLTFDGSKIDREDYKAVVRKFGQWCDNRVRRNGLMYCGVVERHKKSNGLHFHLCTNDSLAFVESGTVKCPDHKKPIKIATADRYGIPEADRKTVYNISDWSYGFSTALEITGDDTGIKVASYLRKYLTKDFEKIGGRYYFSGGNLKRPFYKYVDDDYHDCEFTYEFSVGGKAYRVLNLEE